MHKTIDSFSVYGPLIIVLAGSATLTGACRESSPPQGDAVAPIAVSTATVTSTALASSLEAGGVVVSRTTAVIEVTFGLEPLPGTGVTSQRRHSLSHLGLGG